MTYLWPATDAHPEGAKGTNAFPTREQAEDAARRQAATIGGLSGVANCTAEVTHRDNPRTILATFRGADALPPCGRLLPYAVHESRSAGGRRCGRPSIDMGGPTNGADEAARCPAHRAVDRRTATNREIIARRDRVLGPRR